MVGIALLFGLGLGLFGFMAALRPGWTRVSAALLIGPLYAAIIYAVVGMLGYPVADRLPPDTEIAWYQLDEPRAIYVLASGKGEPRLYVLPWTDAHAEQLTDAAQRAGDGGSIEYSLKATDGGAPAFHGEPPEALPPKDSQ